MEKSNSPCSLDLILGKENLYKNSPINIGSITIGCAKCQDSQQETPATQPTTTDGLKDLVGIPQAWPLADAPEGWLKCNGQAFDKTKYPQLAKLYPAGSLPDLRGEFIRGWDDGRGVDTNRQILSAQSGMLESHNHMMPVSDPSKWNGAVYGYANDQPSANIEDFSQSGVSTSRELTSVTGGNETRPRNIAFSYIVKAG